MLMQLIPVDAKVIEISALRKITDRRIGIYNGNPIDQQSTTSYQEVI